MSEAASQAAEPAAMLTVNNIEVVYNDVILVLRGVSLEVPEGRIVTLLGPNGAGKSTTLKAISGLLKTEDGEVTGGEIRFLGEEIRNADPERIVRKGIFQVMEGRRIVADMTVLENLRLGAFTRNKRDVSDDIDQVFQYFPRLRERTGLAGYLSGGEQQMLAIGRALMTNPRLLILDEATEGLAPLVRAEIWQCLAGLKEAGQSILIIDKNIDALTRLADRH
ncbi:MAG: ABC transporter ATP-binding protein, partial [Minwuiales bacterium]|nr:ABC transporter ATP-binding protein [Minwuiales bacterium]